MSGLFDDPPVSGRTPETRATSRAAAEGIAPVAGTQRDLVLTFVRRCGSRGATDEEIQQGLNLSGNAQRPRRSELEAAGFLEASPVTRRTTSGRAAVVWVSTTKRVNHLEGFYFDGQPT